MKILYPDPLEVKIGGAGRCLLDLVSGVDRSLVEPLAACVREGTLSRALRVAGVKVTLIPWPAFTLRIGRGSTLSKLLIPLAAAALVPHILRTAALVRRERVDIIHTNGLKSHLVGSLVRLLTRCGLVWHAHDVLKPGLTRTLFTLAARWTVDRLIANSRAVAESFPGHPAGRLSIIYNGLDTSLYTPGPAPPGTRASLGLEPADLVVGAIGALAPLKGHIHLIRAAPRVLERCPRAKFLIVGEEVYLTLGHRGYRDVLVEETRRLGLDRYVLFAGYREDPVAVLRCLDVLVHSSVYPESFGRVLTEAMACGVPVVATRLGGPREIVVSEDQGILIPAEDPDAIASAVLRLASDPQLRERLARGGRERVVSAFTVDRYVREIEHLYQDLARARGASA